MGQLLQILSSHFCPSSRCCLFPSGIWDFLQLCGKREGTPFRKRHDSGILDLERELQNCGHARPRGCLSVPRKLKVPGKFHKFPASCNHRYHQDAWKCKNVHKALSPTEKHYHSRSPLSQRQKILHCVWPRFRMNEKAVWLVFSLQALLKETDFSK